MKYAKAVRDLGVLLTRMHSVASSLSRGPVSLRPRVPPISDTKARALGQAEGAWAGLRKPLWTLAITSQCRI